MLPSDDIYVHAFLDYELEDLVNKSSILEDDDANICNQASSSCSVSYCFGTANDDDFVANAIGRKRRSWLVEQWAQRAFNKWPQFKGYLVNKLIVDLSEEVETKPLIEMLVYFFFEVKKQDSGFYNPCT